MSPRSLRFERLAVHRAGERVRRGDGFALEDLSPGVTVLHGPNGSGKSTTALAMQATLWPGKTRELERPALEASLRDDDGVWQVDIDAGHVAVTRDGAPATLDVGPVEHRRRYRLALDDLLV
ncbi:MAG: AAA family ATPase, partial [Trueperaceae bacterium]